MIKNTHSINDDTDLRSQEIHRNIYFSSLIILVISLPFSVFLLSMSMFLLGANWLLEDRIKNRLHTLIRRKSILFILSIYLLHVLGMIYTRNFSYGLHDLRIKLPLLILPLIIGTSRPLPLERIKILFLFFIASVFVSSLTSLWVYLGLTGNEIIDNRDISLFISHIRYSLLVDTAVFSLLYMILFPRFNTHLTEKLIYGVVALWLIIFLIILESFTGIVIFFVVLPVFILNWALHFAGKTSRVLIFILTVMGIASVMLYVNHAYTRFYPVREPEIANLRKKTANGNRYFHNAGDKMLENGHYVWLYVCEKELKPAWNSRSNIQYDSLDKKGQSVKYTLIRYLTSLDLPKDSSGVAALSESDIKAIEKGYSNYIFKRKFGLYSRIYQLIWELDMYKKTGNPNGHSLTQRLEYLKNAFRIIRNHPLFGVGTGDVEAEISRQYENSGSKLLMQWRLRTHNQFVTFILTFGIPGFLWIIFVFVYAVIYEKKYRDFLFVVFLLIAFLSMLNEDTLETHVGISFFSFFFSLFLYGFTNHAEE